MLNKIIKLGLAIYLTPFIIWFFLVVFCLIGAIFQKVVERCL